MNMVFFRITVIATTFLLLLLLRPTATLAYYQNTSSWPGVCNIGKAQSPIDLSAERAAPHIDSSLRAIGYTGNCAWSKQRVELVNKIHTLKIYFGENHDEPMEGCVLKDPTTPAGGAQPPKEFKLVQIHFHHPSEHTLANSQQSSWEIHFVHIYNVTGQLEDVKLLVIAVLGDVAPRPLVPNGNSQGLLMDQLLNPNVIHVSKTVPPFHAREIFPSVPVTAGFTDLFPNNRSYMTYHGSLTTPPCSEIVTWLVLRDKITIYKETVDAFVEFVNETEMEHNHVPFVGNTRPTQPLNGRSTRTFFDYVGAAGGGANNNNGGGGGGTSTVCTKLTNLLGSSADPAVVAVGVGAGVLVLSLAFGYWVGKRSARRPHSGSSHQDFEAVMLDNAKDNV